MLNEGVDRSASSAVVVRLTGELDVTTAPRALEQIRPHLSASGLHMLVLDLSELTFIGSAGLSLLIDAQRQAHAANIAVRLVTGSQCVDRALEITGLSSEFVFAADLESALR